MTQSPKNLTIGVDDDDDDDDRMEKATLRLKQRMADVRQNLGGWEEDRETVNAIYRHCISFYEEQERMDTEKLKSANKEDVYRILVKLILRGAIKIEEAESTWWECHNNNMHTLLHRFSVDHPRLFNEWAPKYVEKIGSKWTAGESLIYFRINKINGRL